MSSRNSSRTPKHAGGSSERRSDPDEIDLTSGICLTAEQQAVVAHDFGPALVFAVAGSGKTAAMTHRIERLVRERVFSPSTILATSFSKASVRDVQGILARWPHCHAVRVQTLHATGLRIIRGAQRRGLLPALSLRSGDADHPLSLLSRTLDRARRAGFSTSTLEALDPQDFLTYVGMCKANLCYADLREGDQTEMERAAKVLTASDRSAAWPAETRHPARQAPAPGAPMECYLDLYQIFETVRREQGCLTFDDLLLTAWECLVRSPDLLHEMRDRCRCLLVDEFQDVSRVQSELLDLLTAPAHPGGVRNLMVLGDDDQTIYGWRGADPGFLLGFERRYGAAKYVLSDNFRSLASHLVLANQVIAQNVRREPKHLSLTRGFGTPPPALNPELSVPPSRQDHPHSQADGMLPSPTALARGTGTFVHHAADSGEQGRQIAALVQEAQQAGFALSRTAVLLRLYAQTLPIEQALMEAGIPYRIVGASPFYERPELLPLIDALRLARWERQMAADVWPETIGTGGLAQCWGPVASAPPWNLPAGIQRAVLAAVQDRGLTLTQSITRIARSAPKHVAEDMREMVSMIAELMAALEEPVRDVMERLAAHLRRRIRPSASGDGCGGHASCPRNGTRAAAEAAASIAAFVRSASPRGTAEDFLIQLDGLSCQRNTGQAQKNADPCSAKAESDTEISDTEDVLTLMTIFRAKGLQWAVVFVPDLNEGIYPYLRPGSFPDLSLTAERDDGIDIADMEARALEEERRLLYVALTRPQEVLHLHIVDSAPISPFLREAGWKEALAAERAVAAMMAQGPLPWLRFDVQALLRYASELHLERYFQEWWSAPAGHGGATARQMQRLLAALRQSRGE